MRVIIAGSRDGITYGDVVRAVHRSKFSLTKIISGTARGADQFGERLASRLNLPIERYPAEWDRFGKSAGYRRNQMMAGRADALIAVWDGVSRGTKHMIDIAIKKGLKVYVYTKEEK